MRLLADCGNTAIKFGLARGETVVDRHVLAPEDAALERFWSAHADEMDELILLPDSRAHAELVARWWGRHGSGVAAMRTLGDDLPLPAVGQYPGLGLDRIVAGIAAARRAPRGVVVIDAGTATTVDAWTPHPSSAIGVRFLGGMILPGPQACLAGLHLLAPALPCVDAEAVVDDPCQRNTVGAIAAGIGLGYAGMVDRCVTALRQRTGIEHVILAGGNAERLTELVCAGGAVWEHLVLDGLAWIAEQAAAAERRLPS